MAVETIEISSSLGLSRQRTSVIRDMILLSSSFVVSMAKSCLLSETKSISSIVELEVFNG